jgi:hypothetical protein
MGCTDVGPFVLGLTQSPTTVTSLSLAATAVLIAVASSNAIKGCYALAFSGRKTEAQRLLLLTAYAVLGLVPLLGMF